MDRLWESAYRGLGIPLQEVVGCRCAGPWDDFQQILNFWLAHAPDSDGILAARSPATLSLCRNVAQPLMDSVTNRSLYQSAHRWMEESTFERPAAWWNFGEHWCPAGLLSALIVCAAAHTHVARANLRDEEEPEVLVDWKSALGEWPRLLPEDCMDRPACLPYLEALLAYPLMLHAQPCLEASKWPIRGEEVHDNIIRWLGWLSTRGANSPPPYWRGQSGMQRVRHPLLYEAAGAFAGKRRAAPDDDTGVASLLEKVSKSWDPSESQSFERPSLRQRHFENIFGEMGRPWKIMARGPMSIQTKVHPDDFKGSRSGLRFYIYNLPSAAHAHALMHLHGRIREAVQHPATCNFGMSACTEMRGETGAFGGYRPMAAEVTFLAKLLSGPDEVIVDDPHQASYFIVPFLSSIWCFLSAPDAWVRCGDQEPLKHVLPLLEYYNASTAHRHLFLGTDSLGNLAQDLQAQPLLLHYGPTPCGPGQGPLIAPPPVTDELPVPGRFEFSSKDLFLFVADGIRGRPYRLEVVEELQRWQHSLPHLFVASKRDQQGKDSLCSKCPSSAKQPEWAHQIRRALFCPVLPGDNTFRMRLFHAVLAGCLPVVIRFPGGSWYRNHGPPVEWSVPFPGQVDWRGFSIELPFDPATEALGEWAKRLVPTLLRLSIEEIHRKQVLLAKAVPLLRYDFAGSQPDAFTALLDELAKRPLEKPELDCFDPRERFATERCITGTKHLAQEEPEIYGITACCPKWLS